MPAADREIDNLRSVLRRCLVHADYARGIDPAISLGWSWMTRATTEGVRWLDELLASGHGDRAIHPWPHFMRGFCMCGFLAVLQSDPAVSPGSALP
jgi:hypothetical protein